AGAGVCCAACCAGGCAAGLGTPGRRDASLSLRNVSLSSDGGFELARRAFLEILFVFGGGFGFCRVSGWMSIMFFGFCVSGTMTAWFLVHLGTSSSRAMMTPCVAREIQAASRRR